MEVRQCRACGQPALVAVRAWDQSHSFYGIPTGTTPGGGGSDLVCQSCGAHHMLRPPSIASFVVLPLGAMFLLLGLALFAMGLVGLLPILALVGLATTGFGVVTVGTVVRPEWIRFRNPVVPGAPLPEIRHLALEPRRQCVCGASARCSEVTANRVNGVYTGTEYAFLCEACQRTFTIESPMEAATTVAGGLFLLWIASLVVPTGAVTPSDWFCTGGSLLLGGGLLLLSGSRLLARIRHPVSPRD